MKLNPYWHDKIALVTGGSSGIGLSLARLLAQQGAHVWIVARRREQLDQAYAQVLAARRSPTQHCGRLSVDLVDPEQAVRAVEEITQAVGVPHVVITSAGVAQPGYVQALGLDIFHWMMDVNYFGTVNVVKAILPGMIARGSGHIIGVSSGVGFIGVFGYTAYGASKFAVNGFMEALRCELKPAGIQVSLAFPPDTDTPQLEYENRYKPPETKALASNVRAMSADAVAEAILIQAARQRLYIYPNFDVWLLHRLTLWFRGAFFVFMDWLIARSRNGH